MNQIALTFDDGPSPNVTPRILAVLEQYHAKATFMMIGCNAEANGELVAKIHASGHQIGNHTWDHEVSSRVSPETLRSVLQRTSEVIEKQCGVTPTIHRPPEGVFDENSVRLVGETGMATIMWSIDPKDWKRRGAETTFRLVLENAEDGDVVLLHDIHEQTADAVERIVPELVRCGFELVTVEELAKTKHTLLTPGKYFTNFHHDKGEF